MKRIFNFLLPLVSLIIVLTFLELSCRFFWKYTTADLLNSPNTESIQNSPEFSMTVKINANGLRDYDYPFKKDKDVFRIVTIGDSMTFGWGVEMAETYPKVLENMLNQAELSRKYEVINVSKLGSGPLRFSQFLDYMGLKYHPDLVIVTFFPGNDLSDDLNVPLRAGLLYEIDSFCKRYFYSYFFIQSKIKRSHSKVRGEKYSERGSNPFSEEHLHTIAEEAKVSFDVIKRRLEKVDIEKIDNAINCYHQGNSYFLSLLKVFLANPAILKEVYTLSSPKWRLAWDRNKSAYTKIKELCLKNGAKMLILLIQAPFQVNRFYLSEWKKYGIDLDDTILQGSKIQDEMGQFCSHEGMPLLDLSSAFKRDTDQQYYFVEDGHWNRAGHRFAAQVIYNRLNKEGLL